jgi:hypothetical protein
VTKRTIIDLGHGHKPWPLFTWRRYRLKKGDRYLGIDICNQRAKAEELIKEANLKGTFEFLIANYLNPWPFEDEAATEVHLHAPNPSNSPGGEIMPLNLDHFLSEAQRVLKPEGEVYSMAESNKFKPAVNRSTLEKHATRHGFKIIKFTRRLPRSIWSYFWGVDFPFTYSLYAGGTSDRFFTILQKTTSS